MSDIEPEGKDEEHLFKEKRYRCPVCVDQMVRIEKVTPKINKLWHPRCPGCGRGMREIDKNNNDVQPKPAKVKAPKPELPGQMSFDGTVTT